jgi:hypothetical protein
MAVDYLKTYLGIDPNDYSAMQSRIAGTPVVDDQFARIDSSPSVNSLRNFGMPQQRSLGDIEAMQLIPRQQPAPQPAPQVDDRYQGLMDQIAALRSQIEGMQAPTEQAPVGAEAPVMADTPTEVNMDDAREMFYQSPEFKEYQRQTEGMAHDMAYRPQNYTDPTTGNTVSFQDRSGLFQDWYKNTYGRDLAVEDNSFRGSFGSGLGGILDESNSIQAPVGIENRAVGEPTPFEDKNIFDLRQETESMVNPYNELPTTQPMPQAPSQDIQASIDYLAKLPKMNIPQIPDIEEIKRKMAEANMNFPEPVSYPDQLQAIRDLPPMTQMPTREEIQAAMQNIPTPIGANITQNPFQKINDILPQSTIDQFQSFASKPNPFVPQAPQMQSVGRPSMPISRGFRPEMRASGGGIDKAIYDLKFKLNGS